ncbi:hypothetical protein SLS55_001502 [Diplodia seriata]|uniref:Heterokaryon incompatibility domain-containing protein n=1 Tax=Diplodia seriata TaxID=420778 RepID=A0ABR3CPP7_9PEZI
MARQVKIWLGPEVDDSDLAMEALKRKDDPELIMKREQVKVRRALEALLCREYWTRVWVVQEILVARSIKILCGLCEVDWESAKIIRQYLKAFTDVLNLRLPNSQEESRDQGNSSDLRLSGYQQERNISKDPREPENRSKAEDLSTDSDHSEGSDQSGGKRRRRSEDWSEWRNKMPWIPLGISPGMPQRMAGIRKMQMKVVPRLAEIREDGSKRGPQWLLDMLLQHRHFKATDRRDKIFSLLGLLDRDLPGNEPQPETTELYVNYNLSFFDVSIQLFNYLTLQGRDNEAAGDYKGRLLNVICASQPEANSDFPTWLPDFSRDNGMEPWPLGEQSERVGDFAARAKLSYDSRALCVRGVEISAITSVTGSEDDCLASDDLSLLTRLNLFTQLFPSTFKVAHHFWQSFVLGEEVGKRLVGTLVATPCLSTNSQVLEAAEAVVKAGSDTSPLHFTRSGTICSILKKHGCAEIFRAFLDEFGRKSYRRRFAKFKRPDGYRRIMAMVPEGAKEGDKLYQLGSCAHWVLLRPIVPNVHCFHFVGPVYLSDAPETWLKFDDGAIQWISIH